MKRPDLLPFLIDLWKSRAENFPKYFQTEFGRVPRYWSRMSRLIIVQTNDGRIEDPPSVGQTFCGKWIYASDSLTEVAAEYEWRKLFDWDENRELFVTPSFAFFADQNDIVLSQRWGQDIHRLRGKVSLSGSGARIEWTTFQKSAFRG